MSRTTRFLLFASPAAGGLAFRSFLGVGGALDLVVAAWIGPWLHSSSPWPAFAGVFCIEAALAASVGLLVSHASGRGGAPKSLQLTLGVLAGALTQVPFFLGTVPIP